MEYKGPGSIVDKTKFIDEYKIFTHNMVDTFKKFGNLLISKERYDSGREKVIATVEMDKDDIYYNYLKSVLGSDFELTISKQDEVATTPCYIFWRKTYMKGDTDGNIINQSI